MANYLIPIFLSAFLLFLMQPVIGKFLLPRFGGSPSVWAVCLFFFQVVLVFGYTYSHFLFRFFSPRQQTGTHLGLLAFSLFWLVVGQSEGEAVLLGELSSNTEVPSLAVLSFLASTAGLPFFLLASTSPLLQGWLTLRNPAASPYRLYSLSNLGSLLALISYPFVVEPLLTLKSQAALWASGYCVFLLFSGGCALACLQANPMVPSRIGISQREPGTCVAAPRWREILLWICLAACASGMLLATTNQLCQEVAVIPFLWIVPLAIYLISFIVCFDSERVYSRNLFVPTLVLCAGASCFVMDKGVDAGIPVQFTVYTITLFVCCMICHGELARMKPAVGYLTSFYLAIGIGGALGGAVVSLAAPWLFSGFWELPLFLWLSCLLALTLMVRDRRSLLSAAGFVTVVMSLVTSFVLAGLKFADLHPGTLLAHLKQFVLAEREVLLWVGCIAVGLAGVCRFASRKISLSAGARFGLAVSSGMLSLTVLASLLVLQARESLDSAVSVSRNFFGLLTVTEEDTGSLRHKYELRHGRIVHGYQYRELARRQLPNSYFGNDSGIGMAILHHPRRSEGKKLRIGVLGLGVGTIAAYGRTGDTVRFYEINPEVVNLSQGRLAYFTYLQDCPAKVDVIVGDGRLSLERELALNRKQDLDVLAIDAFSSDAVPVHLLTQEAMSVYLRHLRQPGGILAFQITNRYLNLKPVLIGLARHFHLYYTIIDRSEAGELAWENTWVLLSTDDKFFSLPNIQTTLTHQPEEVAAVPLWTDDYSNLFQCLKH